MKYRPLITLAVLLFLFHLMSSRTAYAYLDPGTGSYLLQIGLAVLLGGSVAIKIYWRKIRTSLANHFSKRRKDGKNGG